MKRGFKNALIVAAMLSVGAGTCYAASNANTIDNGRTVVVDSDVSGLSFASTGGAYAVSKGTLNINDGIIFNNNKTTGSSKHGGAIWYSSADAFGDIGDNVQFTYNQSSGNGGAIYLNTKALNNVVFGSGMLFDHNSGMQGGAVYISNGGAGATFTDTSFTNNTATDKGGAIMNKGTLTIKSVAGDVTFSGNQANGVSNAIRDEGVSVTINAEANTSVIFNDAITTDSTSTRRKLYKEGLGAIVLGTTMDGYTGDVSIEAGILKTVNKGLGSANTLFANANSLTFAGGTAIDTRNNAIETTDLGSITLNGDIYAMLDVKLSDGTIDNFTTSGTITDNGHKILIGINNLNAIDGSVAATINATVADATTKAYIDLDSYQISGALKGRNYTISLNDGVLTFTGSVPAQDLWQIINESPAESQVIYALPDNYNLTTAGRSSLGTMSGAKLTINGNGHTIDGDGKGGVTISTWHETATDSDKPQELIFNDTKFEKFLNTDGRGGVIYNNGGKLTLSNSTFGDSSDPLKGNKVNRSVTSDSSIDIISSGGGAIYNTNGSNITGITNTNFYSNSVIVSAIVTGSGNANSQYSGGGAIWNWGTIGDISGDFTSNRVNVSSTGSSYADSSYSGGGAIWNHGTIGDISGDFDGNSAVIYATATSGTAHLGSTGGGAIWNLGTINSITGSSFTNNKTNRDGGAIYNHATSVQQLLADYGYSTPEEFTQGEYGQSLEEFLADVGYSSFQAYAEGPEGYESYGSITNGITDTSFTGNTASGHGGAIWSSGDLVIKSESSPVVFSNNSHGTTYTYDGDGNITGISDAGTPNDIYMDASYMDSPARLTLNASDDTNTITLNDGIDGVNYTISINDGTTGTVNFNGGTINGSNGVYVHGGKFNAQNVVFTNNRNSFEGGAIYNEGTITNISGTFGSESDSTKGNITSLYGGAIANSGTIGTINADFYYNKALTSDGGAIYNENEIGTITGNFKGNLSNGLGGAIYNNGTLTVKTNDSENITFSGNYDHVTFDSDGNMVTGRDEVSNAIHNDGGTVTFDGKKDIIFNDRLTGGGTWIKKGTGSLVLAEDMSGVIGDVEIQQGTVKLAKKADSDHIYGTMFDNANKTTWSAGTKIDAQNGNYDTIGLGDSVELLGDVEAYIDINLTEDKTDKFVAGSAVDSSAGKIILTTITSGTLKNICAYPSGVTPPIDGTMIERQIADTNVAGAIQVATDVRVNLENSSGKWILSYNGDTGVLTFNNGWTLPDAIASTANSVVYNAIADEPTLTADLGNLGGVTTSVRMNGKTVDGGGYAGVNIVTSGQELGIKDATFTNFAKTGSGGVINNTKGAVTLENVTIHDASATENGGAVMNDTEGSLTISGSEFYNNESGYDGGAIYNSGSTFIVSGTSSVRNNTANGNGGGIYLINQSANIGGTTFTSNTAKKRDGVNGGDGGAYYAMNATTLMTDVLFSLNKAENSGGALVNAGGTTTLTNATFTSNTADGRGGAIFNIGGGTTTVNKGQFNSNVAKEDFGGGAIFNDGDNSKVVIQNTNNSFTGNYAKQGGAIANFGSQIDVSNASFSGNKAITNSQGGGAILNNGQYRVGTLNILDSSFTNNLASNQGGAISNIGDATKAIVNITATDADITFSGNKQGVVFNADGTIYDDSSAVSNAIYNEGTVTFAGSKTITLNDCITGTANSVYTKNGTGTLVLANDMSGVLGDVILNQGTVKLKDGGNFFSSDSSRAKKVEVAGTGVLLDVKNNNIETVDLGNLVLTKDLKVAVDVDLANSQIDNFKTTGTITGNKSIIIDTVQASMRAINDLAASDYPKPSASGDGVEYQQRRVVTQIADTSIANKFELADHIRLDVREVIDGSSNNHDVNGDNSGLNKGWFMFYNSATGELNFIDQSLRTTLKDTSSDNKKYIMVADEVVESHLNDIIGTGSGANTTVQIIGQNHKIDGNGFKGVVVDNGQKIIVENVAEASGFAKTSDNGAFINVKSGGEADITASIIKGNTVRNGQGGAVYLHEGTLVLDGTTFDSNSATKTGSYGGSGGAIYNYKGTISEAVGASQSTFTGNTAAAHGGAIGNVGYSNSEKATIESLNAQFTNNSAGSNGGAIYNRLGDINNISGTFTANTAKNGGAIYNQSGTITISNATFTDNGSTENGGAVYNGNGTSSIIMSDVNFVAKTGTNKNDIYNAGTINITGGTTTTPNIFASDITNIGSIDFGGTNIISSTIDSSGSGDNAVVYSGTNTLTSTSILAGGNNEVKSGTLDFEGTSRANLKVTGGTVNSTGTLDNDSVTTVDGGTFNMSGGSAESGSTIDVNSGNMNFTGGNLKSGSATTVDGGTMTMDGGTMVSGSTVTLTSGTLNYKSGTVDGTLAADGGALNVQNNLTIKNDSYIADAAQTTIDSGKTLTIEDLTNTTGVQLNSNDTWAGNVVIGNNGILSVTDIVNGNLTQNQNTAVSNFNNAVLNMANANISAGDVNMSSSVLNYVAGNAFAPDNLNLSNSSTINLMNGNASDTFTLNSNVSTIGTNNITLDLNPDAGQYDKIVINGDLTGVGALNVSDFNYIGATPKEKNYQFQLFDLNGSVTDVDFLAGDKEFKSAIGNYRIMSNGGGAYTFGLTSYNPQAYRGQVATMAAYNNQININNMVLDQLIFQNNISPTDKTANRYASVQSLFSPYQHTPEEGGLWYKSYVDFETLSFNHGLKSHNTAYGSLMGADLPLVHLKRGWDYIPTFYVGYNGATQDFNGVTMYQNGGQGGYMGTFIHKDFIGSIMAYAGGYNNQMKVNGEDDNAGNWFAGTATKLAYNFHPTKHFIIQPTAFVSYNIFGKQHWSSDFGSVGMNSGLLNGINVAPGLNLIYKRDTWSVYATFQYMYNINEQVSGRAAHVYIPRLNMRHGYLQYGIRATKTWKDQLPSYVQVAIRNGGRTGIGFQLGVKYSIDWNLKSKSKTKNPTTSSSAQRHVLKG